MPILWSYLLRKYFRIFFLSTFSFVLLLLVTRLKEIARFAALASHFTDIFKFTALQIPYILPLAFPVSCFIAAITLFRSLSSSKELNAFRASGIPLFHILSPPIFAASLLALAHFYICSELTSYAKHKARKMVVKNTTANPLVLLKRQKLIHLEDSYIDFELSSAGKKAKNLTFVIKNPSKSGLMLISAKNFFLKNQNLIGEKASIISTFQSEKNGYDKVIIENQDTMTTYAPELSSLMKKSKTRMNPSSLPVRLLKIHAKKNNKWSSFIHELTRRASLAFSVITFTFLGACFGIDQSRNPKVRKLLWAVLYSCLVLVCYLIAKQLKSPKVLSLSLFILPHILVIFVASFTLKKISRGVE